MKLIKFLEENGIAPYELAQSAGVAPSVMYKLINEEGDIFLSVAVRISRSTNWVVRPEELLADKIIEKRIKRPSSRLAERIERSKKLEKKKEKRKVT